MPIRNFTIRFLLAATTCFALAMGVIVFFFRPIPLRVEFNDMDVRAIATPNGETEIEISGRIHNIGSETFDVAHQIVDFRTECLVEKAGQRLASDHYLPMRVTKLANQNEQRLAPGENIAFRHTLSIPHSQLKNGVARVAISASTTYFVPLVQRRGYAESPPHTINER